MFHRNLLFKGVIALGTLLMATNYSWLLQGFLKKPISIQGEHKLSQDVVRKMLSVYNNYAGHISTEKNKARKLLFAFVSDNDMVVNAVDLMKHLKCQAIYPQNFHRSLATDQEVCETILFFFTRGLGSELYVTNRPEFDAVIELANIVKKKEDLGGNSAQMALRAFKEGADVYLNSMMSRDFYEQLFNSSISIVPESHLSQIRDIHLVIDFTEGEKYGELHCPRTNRLFLQSDIDNMRFPGLDKLDMEVSVVKPDVFVISGFQLMNQRERELIDQTLSMLSSKIDVMKEKLPDLKFHFEMGAFTDQELMKVILDKIFYKIHSTGLNEQELILLTEFIQSGKINIGDVKEADLTTNALIQRVIGLVDYLTKNESSPFERVHFHSSSIQMICSTSNWKNKKFAVSRSILVGLTQAMKKENDNRIDFEYNGVSEDLESIQPHVTLLPSVEYENKTYSYHQLSAEEMNIDDLVQCWNIKRNISCCIGATLINPSPERTCGLGDNIAATSLLYQVSSKGK